jgi:hypothetical protein
MRSINSNSLSPTVDGINGFFDPRVLPKCVFKLVYMRLNAWRNRLMTAPASDPTALSAADLIDVHEAARITGLCEQSIYRLSKLGRLRTFRTANRLRFDRADVLRLTLVHGPNARWSHISAARHAPERDRLYRASELLDRFMAYDQNFDDPITVAEYEALFEQWSTALIEYARAHVMYMRLRGQGKSVREIVEETGGRYVG